MVTQRSYETSRWHFLARTHGPFGVQYGTDGVDAYFSVYCETTRRELASIYFWEESQRAEATVYAVAWALNSWADYKIHMGREHARWFAQENAGPFVTVPERCPYRGQIHSIQCQQSGSSIVLGDKPILVVIADALNRMNEIKLDPKCFSK